MYLEFTTQTAKKLLTHEINWWCDMLYILLKYKSKRNKVKGLIGVRNDKGL